MEGWKVFFRDLQGSDVCSFRDTVRVNFDKYKVYPDSIHELDNSLFFLAIDKETKVLIVTGEAGDRFNGEKENFDGIKIKICPMDNENCNILRHLFDFTNPSYNKNCKISVGFGDRLGIASPGHIRLIKKFPVFPVLAQQSVRELNLTSRSFVDVVAAASWAVFQEGYTKGFGADGDHLKSHDEVKSALESGCTMITLDCSEYIRNDLQNMPESVIREQYALIDRDEKKRLETEYLGQTFSLRSGTKITFPEDDFYTIVLTYYKAIQFMEDIYIHIIAKTSTKIDFEISIDETLLPTSPAAHFFVAMELKKHKVNFMSMAPHFCGEFQKGIDYRGNLPQFESEYILHEEIAQEFGYKLSIHSGSDKLSVFPCIGRYSASYHLKTAGTNWLEAVRLIAEKKPNLYRRMHKFALEHFYEATKYYHVTTDLSKIPDTDKLDDSQLPSLMNLDDTRQMIHITYGLILQAKNPDGSSLFYAEFYKTLFDFESYYYELLEKHLGRHLKYLGIIPQ